MSVDYEVLELQLQIAEQKLATVDRNLQITHQSLLDAQAELGQVRPVSDAAHLVCAEWLAGIRPGGKPGHLAWNGLLAAHRATTPSETESSHVIVSRAELESLRAIADAAAVWTLSQGEQTELPLRQAIDGWRS